MDASVGMSASADAHVDTLLKGPVRLLLWYGSQSGHGDLFNSLVRRWVAASDNYLVHSYMKVLSAPSKAWFILLTVQHSIIT